MRIPSLSAVASADVVVGVAVVGGDYVAVVDEVAAAAQSLGGT